MPTKNSIGAVLTVTSKDGRGRKRTVGYKVQIPDKTRPKKPTGATYAKPTPQAIHTHCALK